VASRRGAEELIREGRVTVNGRVVEVGERADPEQDHIRVDGKRLRVPSTHRYVLLNKPRGVVTTRTDPEGRQTVFDLLPRPWRKSLVPAGRLDYASEGLLVLTDDGDLVHRVTHARFGCAKTYAVKVKGTPDETEIERLRGGVDIDGRRTAPARIELIRQPRPGRGEKNSWWQVELVEGRNRQIREMFFRIGHPVRRLVRVKIGSLTDPGLPVGSYRFLSEEEVARLRRGGRGRWLRKSGAGEKRSGRHSAVDRSRRSRS
jgi:23S rRNA pseudouridine2605 synthase